MDGFFENLGLDIGLYLGYLLLFGAAIAAVVFPLLHAIKNPKEIAKSGISLGVMLVLFLLAYLLAGDELTNKYQALGVTTSFSSKIIGAGLTMFYFTLVIAIGGMIYSEIAKAFK